MLAGIFGSSYANTAHVFSLVLAEANGMYEDFIKSLESRGLNEEMYLSFAKTTKDDILEHMKGEALTRLQNTYLIDAIINKENIDITDEESKKISPYRITVTNKGNVAYKFNLLLTDTSTGRTIDYEYIKVQVGKLTPVTLKSCQDNIIKQDIVVLPNKSVDIDVRLWLADNIKNSEIGKSFYAKLSISGIAVDDNKEVDNQNLVADKISRATTYLKEIYENIKPLLKNKK